MTRTTAAISLLTSSAMLACFSGCAGQPESSAAAPASTNDAWSSKEQSTMAVLPDRPDVDLGPRFEVVVDETNARAAAMDVLRRAVDSTNPLLRMNAIEGLKPIANQAIDSVRKGLGDENRAVRFVSAMLVGEAKLTELRPLVEPLLLDESDSVRAAAIYAIRRCGGKPDMNPLAAMVLGDDPEVKGNAALVLGELGEPSAVSLLRVALERGLMLGNSARRRMVDLQIAEAMIKLGDLRQLEVVRAALFSRPEEGEITALACQICGEVQDEGSLPNLLDLATRTGLQQQSAEVRMAAATAVSRINPARSVLYVPESYASHSRFELRTQAALTLGASEQKAALPTLVRMLQDSNPLVQIAAAAGIVEITQAGN